MNCGICGDHIKGSNRKKTTNEKVLYLANKRDGRKRTEAYIHKSCRKDFLKMRILRRDGTPRKLGTQDAITWLLAARTEDKTSPDPFRRAELRKARK